MKNKPFAALNYMMLAVFLMCVVVQFNDPDTWVWVGIYGFGAGACVLAALRRLHWGLSSALALIALIWGIILASRVEGISWSDLSTSLSMKTLEVEEAREAGGLFLLATWMVVLTIATRWARR
jgi:hypothetical protein